MSPMKAAQLTARGWTKDRVRFGSYGSRVVESFPLFDALKREGYWDAADPEEVYVAEQWLRERGVS